MIRHFDNRDKRLFVIAIILLLVFSYLLFDDRLLMDFMINHGQQVAKVIHSENDVRQKSASDFRWISVRSSIIYENDSIFTGKDSGATVVLSDNTEIHLKENSMITFRTVQGQLVLGLQYGQISGNVEKIKVEQKVERKPTAKSIVNIPVIVSPESHTKKTIALNLHGDRTEEGKVQLAWKYDKQNTQFEIELSNKKDFSVIEHKMTSPELFIKSPELKSGIYYARVREIIDMTNFSKWSKPIQFEIAEKAPQNLPTPELLTKEIFLKIEDGKPARIAWTTVEGADDYVVRISEESNSKNQIQLQSKTGELILKNAKPGFYKFHVQAKNNFGLQSLPSEDGYLKLTARAPILSKVDPQFYILKDDNDKAVPTQFNLKWSEVQSTDKYSVEIATNSEFRNAKQFQTRSPASLAKIDKSGQYFWRVRSLSSTGKPLSDYSAPGKILYQSEKPLRSPALVEPFDKTTLFFQKKNQNIFYLEWESTVNATNYTVQIAKDPDFKQIVFTKQLASTRYLLKEQLPSGELFWRVRAEGKQRISNWSDARLMNIQSGRSAKGQ